MGCLRIFLASLSKVFPEGNIKPYEGTSLTIDKVLSLSTPSVNPTFVSFGCTGERLIAALRRKEWILRALFLAVTSLGLHK